MTSNYSNHDEYISSFPEEIQERMQLIRKTIHTVDPNLVESIGYNMPSFKKAKTVCYFCGHKNHIGFYPTSKPIEHFKERLQGYKFSKGAIQFQNSESIPIDLIVDIVRYRLETL